MFANYECTGVGINSSTADVVYNNYSFNSSLYMLIIDFAIFFFVGLYMDKVIPMDYGQRMKPWYICSPSYYKCCKPARRRDVVMHEGDQE